MMEIETKGAGPKERQEMRMKQEEKREKRWEEKRRREEGQTDEGKKRRKRIFLIVITAVILFAVVPAVVPILLYTSVQIADSREMSAGAGDEIGANETPADAQTIENAGAAGSENAAAYASAAALKAAVSCREYVLPEELLFLCINDNSVTVDINVNVVFFDEAGQLLSIEDAAVWSCGPGERAVATARLPHDTEYNRIPFDHYDLEVTVEETSESMLRKNYGPELTITSNIGTEGTVLAMVENPTGITFYRVRLICLYYQGDNVMGYSTNYLENLSDREAVEFYTPNDPELNPIPFDDYKILVTDTEIR